uniref:Uncharacterized protein n=1 Tax=Noctiluca scintillans TaxID=2966 RepID=A0A6T8RTG5_NOCSC|eukprot:CAMPEP_0194496598 /NCGR_PEP_ID=MMETSP0253-20130528/13822_1 /TAXON_ID=2966 /ORGANISM="Noctiluca scintillans" /LENGTH=165 /DNA_ID=CAMNT_0039338017 /DNA_START=54 /DNA_END=551 /DNA_ORIENTATION=+
MHLVGGSVPTQQLCYDMDDVMDVIRGKVAKWASDDSTKRSCEDAGHSAFHCNQCLKEIKDSDSVYMLHGMGYCSPRCRAGVGNKEDPCDAEFTTEPNACPHARVSAVSLLETPAMRFLACWALLCAPRQQGSQRASHVNAPHMTAKEKSLLCSKSRRSMRDLVVA